MYFLTVPLLVIFFIVKGDDLRRFFENTDRLTKNIMECGLGSEELFEKRYRSTARKLEKFSMFMAVSNFVCPMVFSVSVPLIDLLNGEYRTRTAVPAQCSIELEIQTIPGVFELIVIQQVTKII